MNYDLDTEEGMANAKAWTQDMIDRLSNSGSWVVPRSGTVVSFDKHGKKCRVCSVIKDESVARVLRELGYEVSEEVV
jgi:hypothetical protein